MSVVKTQELVPLPMKPALHLQAGPLVWSKAQAAFAAQLSSTWAQVFQAHLAVEPPAAGFSTLQVCSVVQLPLF